MKMKEIAMAAQEIDVRDPLSVAQLAQDLDVRYAEVIELLEGADQ